MGIEEVRSRHEERLMRLPKGYHASVKTPAVLALDRRALDLDKVIIHTIAHVDSKLS
jgi:hypothetical protein